MLGRLKECNAHMQAEKKGKDEAAARTAAVTDKEQILGALQAKFDKMSKDNEL